jgi:hypothetical protein
MNSLERPMWSVNEQENLHFKIMNKVYIWVQMIMRKFGVVNHFALIVCLVANKIWVQRRKWPFEVHLESPHGSMLTSPLTTTCKTRGKRNR